MTLQNQNNQAQGDDNQTSPAPDPNLELPAQASKEKKTSLFKKVCRWICPLPFFMLWGLIIALGLVARKKLNVFFLNAQISPQYLLERIQAGLTLADEFNIQKINNKTILVMGVDSLENRGDVPPLTDTLLLVCLHFDKGQINLISLPRDLWNETYQTKINALLAYGYDRDQNDPSKFPMQVVSEMTSIPIDYSLVLSLSQLEELIDIVGGVDVEITEGFTDDQYPRDDVDIYTETDPAKLYETVSFQQGRELMSGQRALKYIRSRHSADEEGNDIARNERQQQVFNAFFTKLSDTRYFYDYPEKAGLLYQFYAKYFEKSLPLSEMVAMLRLMTPNMDSIEIQGQTISVDPDNPDGVIYNPPLWKYKGLWVFEIKNIPKFQQEIKDKLGY